ncbi:hypothetical protein CAMRE0001_2148 [Campylobacter rectus RM3267]|uniref:Uncharacterized protein n=1 Tax=Campylobacter rectus RM3267 TaxID=553218 RepID=B9D452_CAMRE|nr:hypothetical protein CAMRE0001_2148 [Campylobacter rectus RM3267]
MLYFLSKFTRYFVKFAVNGQKCAVEGGYRVWLRFWLEALSVADQIYARFLNLYFVVTALKFYYCLGF